MKNGEPNKIQKRDNLFTLQGIRQREAEAYDKGRITWPQLAELLARRSDITLDELEAIERLISYRPIH